MTSNEITLKLYTARTLMDLYEQWFLSGNVTALANLHNLVAKPVLKELADQSDDFDFVQKLDFECEVHRSMLCCRLFGNMNVASHMVAHLAAAGDDHFASLILDRRERTVLDMAADSLLLEEDLFELAPETFARLLRVMNHELGAVYHNVVVQLGSFRTHLAELENSDEYSVDEDAVAEFEDFAEEAADALNELRAWFEAHHDVDPGDEFIKQAEAEDKKKSPDGGLRIGVGILGGPGLGDLLEMLGNIVGGDDEPDSDGPDEEPERKN